MSVDGFCTMPVHGVQDDFTSWCSASTLSLSSLPGLVGPDDSTSMDDFNMLNELADMVDVDKLGLFPDSDILFDDGELPPVEDIMMDEFAILVKPREASEVRHDCMWAGTCVSVDHGKERPDPEERLQPSPVKVCAPRDSVREVQHNTVQPSRVFKSHNQRSLLRTNVNTIVSSKPVRYQTRTVPDDSDDSGRPETPQSLSEGEDEEPIEMKHGDPLDELDEVDGDADDLPSSRTSFLGEDEDSEPCKGVPASEVTGQELRLQTHSFDVPSSLGHVSRVESRASYQTHHYISDHSYHLSKSNLSATIPGNLTPSDSEEDEIDVVSVSGSVSRSSSQGGALPTNPSARDRQALQQSVASAMKKSPPSHGHPGYPTFAPGRQSGKLARMHEERQRQRERKRRAQERDDSSEEDIVRPTKKRAKHHGHHGHLSHHAYKTKRAHASRASSSDSEPDSCEKRSLHNNMERQRRVDLRNAFEDLRVEVPTLSGNPRAAKVVILKEASQYCHQLTADSRMISQEMAALKREQERLLARVSHLRKQRAYSFK